MAPAEQALAEAVSAARDTLGHTAALAILRNHIAALDQEARGNEYPRVLYHGEGDTKVVVSKHDEDEAGGDGFGRQPHPVHRGQAGPQIAALPEAASRDAQPEMPDATAKDREPGSATPALKNRRVKAEGGPDDEPDFSGNSIPKGI